MAVYEGKGGFGPCGRAAPLGYGYPGFGFLIRLIYA